MASEWWDELCWGFAVMAIWGLVRQRFILGLCRDRRPGDRGRAERLVLGVFAAVFLLVLLRHTASLGYLSGRHMLPLVAISVPWAAAGTFVCLRGLGVKLPWSRADRLGDCILASGPGRRDPCGLPASAQPSHPLGPLGGGAVAGRARQALRVVLDTRGWARFISGAPGYDYWHVRQALTDSHLTYVVVGHEELAANSPRARTLNALLAYAATPVEDFPVVRGRSRRRRADLPVPPARLMGGTGPMSYGSLWERLVRGVRWSWVDPRYQSALPPDLDASVMTLESRDRLHAKQGRSTARVVFHPAAATADRAPGRQSRRGVGSPGRCLSQAALPASLACRLAALFDPAGRHSPGAAEWAHLERARALGVPVPDVVATGERIGPWACLQSYLMVAELTGCQELNVALPELADELDPASFAALKRRLVAEMARITAALHTARDLPQRPLSLPLLSRPRAAAGRSGRHPAGPDRPASPGRASVLARPLAVEGPGAATLLDRGRGRDRRPGHLPVLDHYRRRVALRWPRWQARMVQLKARRYLEHNRGRT